jgi:hypothetical protein
MVDEKIVYDPTAQSLPADSAAILNKVNNGELKVKGKEKKHKVTLPKEVHKALEKIAQAEGKTPDEKAAEIIKEKAKPKPEETSVFPADARINDYNFLHFKTAWLENLGWAKGMALKIDRNPDGSITLRKE